MANDGRRYNGDDHDKAVKKTYKEPERTLLQKFDEKMYKYTDGQPIEFGNDKFDAEVGAGHYKARLKFKF